MVERDAARRGEGFADGQDVCAVPFRLISFCSSVDTSLFLCRTFDRTQQNRGVLIRLGWRQQFDNTDGAGGDQESLLVASCLVRPRLFTSSILRKLSVVVPANAVVSFTIFF